MPTKRLLRIATVPISLDILLKGQFQYMRENGFEVLTVSANGKEVEEIRKKGFDHVVVPFTRTITPVRDFICLVKLVWLIRNFHPDVVHTHTPKAGLLGMVASWICGIPVRLHTVAGLPLMEAGGIKKQIFIVSEKITLACATQLYPNSVGLKDFMNKRLKMNSHKIKVIGKGSSNGIDTEFFKRTNRLEEEAKKIRQRYDISAGTLVFSFVGRIVRDKGIRELIKAFKKIADNNSYQIRDGLQVRLLLIGPFDQNLDQFNYLDLEFIRNDPRVILAGFQEDVRPWMLASDIFIFPSYREGFPNVVMQAASLELACIVTDINGCNEIIEQGLSGLIVPKKDADSLLNAIICLAGDEEKRKRLGSNARAFVAKNFEQQYLWQELLNEYNNLLREALSNR